MSGSLAEGESLELRMENGERGEQLASHKNEPTAFEGLDKFRRLKPTILGAIEVTIGISMALTAITYLAVDVDLDITAILFWDIFISGGPVTETVLLTAKDPSGPLNTHLKSFLSNLRLLILKKYNSTDRLNDC
ncbi:unnamed protein product [Boreogadus saida]